MEDKEKTKEELISELEESRESIAELRASLDDQNQAKEISNYLKKIIESSLDGIVVTDHNGHITSINQSFLQLLGLRNEEVIGKHMVEFGPTEKGIYKFTTGQSVQIDEKYFEDRKRMYHRFLEVGKIHNWEGYLVNKDKKMISVEYNMVLLHNKEGATTGAVGIIRDITKRKRSEEDLRVTKDFLENIFKTSADGMIVTDSKGYLTMANTAAEKMVGHSQDELSGKHLVELLPKGMKHKGKQYQKRLEEEGRIRGAEHVWTRKDGSLFDVDINASLLKNKEGNITGVVATIRDITERKKAEKEIKEGKEFLESVLENSMDGLAIVDDKGHIISFNTALEKMCKFKKEELIGKHISSLTIEDKDLRKKIIKKTRELFEKGFTRYEAVNKTKDGTSINVECNNSLIKDDRGNIIAGVSIIRNVTDQKNADKKIQETKDFLENIFMTSVDGIMVSDSNGLITMANEATQKMLGYTKNGLIGKRTIDLVPKDKKHQERGRELIERLYKEGIVTEFELTWLKKDGSVVDIELNEALLKNSNGNHIGVVATIRDITERKLVEKKLIEYQNQLRSLSSQLTLTEEQQRRKFAESLHDYIGQSLFISKIKLEMLQKSGLSSNSAKTLDEILKLTEQMINDTRFLTFELSPPILYQLGFEPALEWLIEQIEKQHGISADFKDDKQLKPLDDDISILLFRVVRELLINVVKHAQAQNVKVSTWRNGGKIQICVEDDGIGFTLSKTGLFDSESKRFGLFSIKERLDQLGGYFKVESIPHHGTRMTIEAPLRSTIS